MFRCLLVFCMAMIIAGCGDGSNLNFCPEGGSNCVNPNPSVQPAPPVISPDNPFNPNGDDPGGTPGGDDVNPGINTESKTETPIAPIEDNGVLFSFDNSAYRTISYQRLLISVPATNLSGVTITGYSFSNNNLIEVSSGANDKVTDSCTNNTILAGGYCYIWFHAKKQNDFGVLPLTISINYTISGKSYKTLIPATAGSVLYAGGSFNFGGGMSDNYHLSNLAKFDGVTWSSVGTGTAGTVYGVAVDSFGYLFIAGDFPYVGNSVPYTNRIARWNGAYWFNLATPNPNGIVRSVASTRDGNVYIGGDFTLISGSDAYHVARFDGAGWNDMHGGIAVNSVNRIVTDAADDGSTGNSVYVLGDNHIVYKSTSSNDLWKSILSIDANVQTPFIVSDNAGHVDTFNSTSTTTPFPNLWGQLGFTITQTNSSLLQYDPTKSGTDAWTALNSFTYISSAANQSTSWTFSNDLQIFQSGMDYNGNVYTSSKYYLCSSLNTTKTNQCGTIYSTPTIAGVKTTIIDRNFDFGNNTGKIYLVPSNPLVATASGITPNYDNSLWISGSFNGVGIGESASGAGFDVLSDQRNLVNVKYINGVPVITNINAGLWTQNGTGEVNATVVTSQINLGH